jgi:trimeric autotransporter adhesin
MRRRLLAFIAGAVLLPAVAAGSAAADDPLVQGAGQSASSQQTAGSSATSTQSHPSNTNISVRIGSEGDGGVVAQTNGSSATSVAGNANNTNQQVAQQGGAPGVAVADQSATNGQTAESTANSTQDHPSNTNISVRIMSPGDDGSVTQTNDSSAKSAAGNKNSTTQSAGQSGGGVQTAKQDAANKQSANSSASSTQDHPSNVNIPVRIYSDGDNGSVEQVNDSSAKSAAGNKNETTQNAGQGSGSMSAPVRDACGGGCGDHGGPSVQDAEQSASSDQSARSSASSEQDHPSNVNIPVRIGSSGDDGRVKQINSSSAVSAAGNKNATDQSVEQSAGGSGSGSAVQYADQKAGNTQDATSSATSHQSGASNANYPVRIGSSGGGGSVTQVNGSSAISAAGNKNHTTQNAAQNAGSPVREPVLVRDGCDECAQPLDGCREKCGGGGGPVVQDVKQKASNDQTADSSAESTQCCASNTNAPVRIKSEGDDGDVTQANLSGAISVAGNKNHTTQNATQDAGSAPVEMVRCDKGCGGHGDGGPVVQKADQTAYNDQSAHSSADSTQKGASNSNAPVRIKSDGGGGSVTQVNGSLAASAAGNKNTTDQSADQSAGGSSGGPTVQALGQKAVNGQEAGSHATSEQDGASNSNSPVRIKSSGDDGDVTQANLSGAFSVAGNKNDTTQNASQNAGGREAPVLREDGCGSCGGDGATVQGLGQWASSEQSADSSADSTQKDACNTNSPVRIKSRGDDGDVKQINASAAKSAAGNDNETNQSADQAAGWGGVNVQALGQKAKNGQGARSNATSQQYAPSNANAPVRIHSTGGGGSVAQINASAALSAAGNRNATCQTARQGSGGVRGCEKKVRKPVHVKKVD